MNQRQRTRKYHAQRQARMRALLDWFAAKVRCCDCGRFGIQFHHRSKKSRKFGVNIRAFCRSWKSIVLELLKCDPLCARCHRKRHRRRKARHA